MPCGDSLDFAVALDWYNKIVDGGLGEHTPLADLVHRGKYWYESPLEIEKLREVGLAVVHEMVTFIGEHPLLRTMDTIAAVPGHDAKVVSFGSRVAAAIARELGIPLIACGAHQEFRAPAKSLEPSDRARALAGQFHCHVDVSGKRVLIVDDVYGSGATVEETARALRAAGSNCLAGIAAVRTMKSC
ncbi:ComF family protein [Mycobacteroides chelonae]|uniref:ComF family protein n=1 Tax=Mycobacteroides chelonae TaxID=1774 RepID=UPI0013DE8735|nr:phosphoribosyltransferase family protein [Mycobacteroides chelonae]